MNDEAARTPGPGWWIASDGELYPPEEHPDTRALLEDPLTANGRTNAAEHPAPQAAEQRAEQSAEQPTGRPAEPGGPPAPGAAQRMFDAASSGARHLSAPRPLVESRTGEPPTDDLGGSLHWAFGALRQHLGPLAGVSVLVVVVGLLSFIAIAVIELGVASLGWASLSAAAALLARLAQLCISAWVVLAMVRSWVLAASDEPLELTEVLGVRGFLPYLATFVLVGPILFFTGGAAWAFAIIALMLTAGAHMSPGAALGRMLADTCGSAKRFFQTLLISVLFSVMSWTILLVSSALFVQVTTGAAISTISNGFEEVSEIHEAEANFTVLAGTALTAVVAIGLGLLLWNLFGLWVARYTRRLTERPAD